jgi:hypothetical protein
MRAPVQSKSSEKSASSLTYITKSAVAVLAFPPPRRSRNPRLLPVGQSFNVVATRVPAPVLLPAEHLTPYAGAAAVTQT